MQKNMLVVKRKIYAYLFLCLLIFSLLPLNINPTIVNASDPPLPNFTLVNRGATWNEYVADDGTHLMEIKQIPINYYDGQQYQPINTSFEILASDHPAYAYGYRAGVEQAPFNTYFKPNAQDNYPVAFAYNKSNNPIQHVLRSKLSAVAYYDPTIKNYEIIQTVQDSQGTIDGNTGTYQDVFTGTDAVWKITPIGLKEEIVMSNATKTVLQNNPPSSYGLSDQYSYLVFITKLDYQNLQVFNNTEQETGNFTTDGDIAFKDIIGNIKFTFPMGIAYQFNGSSKQLTYRLLQYQGNQYLLSGIKIATLNNMVFPVTIDPSLNVQTNSSDGYIGVIDAVYNSAWNANSGTPTQSDYFVVGQSEHADYHVYRTYLYFNTTSLPDVATINSACLYLKVATDYSSVDFNVVIQKNATDTRPSDPLQSDDYNKGHYDGDLGSKSTTKISGGQLGNITLNSTGLANISLTNMTKFCLRSYQDIVGTQPTDRTYLEFYSSAVGGATGTLYINYTSKPVVTTNHTTLTNSTYAHMHGYLDDDGGGGTTTSGFRYGTSSGVYTGNATYGTVTTGTAFNKNITGLAEGQLYYYQAWANNSYGFDNASEKTVITRPNATTSFTATVTATGMNLDWTHGTGYNKSVLVVNTTGSADYPHNPTDGTVIYNGTSNTYHHTPLVNNTIYYYTIWEYSEWVYNSSTTIHKFSHLNQTANKEFAQYNIRVNATTGITSSNATFHGYVPQAGGDFSGNYNYGFWVGQKPSVNHSNADYNYTGAGVVAAGSAFSHNGTVATGKLYYVKCWIDNSSYFNTSFNEEEFYSHPGVPTGFMLTLNGDNVDIAWVKGNGADRTVILRRNGTFPVTPQDPLADHIYNNTGTSFSDTAQKGNRSYYRAWSWYGDNHSDTYVEDCMNVSPAPPSNVVGSILGNNTLNITWTNGTGATRTVIRRTGGAYPTTPQSGTETYNGTGQYNFEGAIAQAWYYSLWSFSDEMFSTQVNVSYGALIINCYDEENNSLSFDVFISNQSGSETYESKNANNPHVIDIDLCPTGLQTSIQLSAIQSYDNLSENFTGYLAAQNETTTYIQLEHVPKNKSSTNVTCTKGSNSYYPNFVLSDNIIYIYPDACPSFDSINISYVHEKYRERFYYLDLYRTTVYILNAYLPLSGDANLYYATIKDEYGEPLKDAKVTIKKYIYDEYKNISISYTDSDGQTSLFLVPNIEYIVIVNKSNFDELEARWTPDPDYYGIYYPKYFTIQSTSPEIPTETFSDICVFTGEWVVTNNTLSVYFYDKNDETENTVFRIYESYNESLTFMESHSYTTEREITFYNSSALNISRMYEIRLEINHTSLGYIVNQTIYVMPLHPESEKIKVDWINSLIISVFGDFDFNYIHFGLIFVPCFLFITIGGVVHHPGLGIVIAGGYLALFTWSVSVSIGTTLTTLITLFLLIGFIVIIGKKGRGLIK